MTRCATITFQVGKLPKTQAKLICTKVSFNITLWNRHVYIDIRLRWMWIQ